MPSLLDQQLQAFLASMTAPDAPFALTEVAREGQMLPMFRQAPPHLPAFFAQFCAQHRDAEFLVDGDLRLSFGETHAAAARLANALIARHGVIPGARVAIAARNSAAWVVAAMAVLMAGGCATLLNGWWTGEELAHGIALAQCTLVLADDTRADRLANLPEQTGAPVLRFTHAAPAQSFAAIVGDGTPDTPLPQIDAEDPALLLFTSGSTAACKGAWSDHRAVVQATLNFTLQSLLLREAMVAKGIAVADRQTALVAVPLFHVTGFVPLLLQSLVIGRRLVMMKRWDAIEAMRLIAAERVTYFLGVPLMSHAIATHPERARFDLSCCQSLVAGGAPRPPAHVGHLRAGLPESWPALGYGLTETNAVGCTNALDNYLAKPGSTGPASRPLVELTIRGDDGAVLPAGEVGEVAIRSICNFRGYWNDPAATAAALSADGAVLTGDIGRLDEDSYLFIVDRKKDIVIRGGENIACVEVEQAIYAHPDIAEASVFGLPDEHFGEVPAAVFFAKPGRSLTSQALREFLSGRLAAFKQPARLWCHGEPLPRLGSEKVDKRALRAIYTPLA